ncbi:BCL-6 corepressor-like protein 1 [Halyomorpha halys]|uniref:BCL-6 corepressor-like protein 1 n=1 Tax=Halyomorpha halys TaxID=286706 RepID=UPI0034D30394
MFLFVLLPLLAIGVVCESDQQKSVSEERGVKRSADPGIVAGQVGYAGLSSIGTGAALIGDGGVAAVPAVGGRLVSQLVEVQNTVGVPAPVPIAHPVPVGLPVPVSHPLPIKVPVPVPVVQTVEVPYEKVVPYPVIRRVPVEVVRKIPVPVPDPYPVKVPVYQTKHIYYSVRPKYHHHGW